MKKLWLLLLSTAAGQLACAQSGYKMQPVNIQTRWAKLVSPVNDLKEYPRPQLSRTNWENLNGLWDYAITKKDESPLKYEGRILVPFPIESALSGVKKPLMPDQNLWYKRKLHYTPQKGIKTLLHFGAVDWQATVFINGREAGKHQGGYTAFTIDITGLLKPGVNELSVKVFDPTDDGINPRGKQTLRPENIYYTPSSGIWQTVWLERVADQYIENLEITPDIDQQMVRIKVNADSDQPVTIFTAGKTLKGKSNQELTIKIGSTMHLWSPDDPYLYPLTVQLGNDQVKSYFGMRKIAIQKDTKGIDQISLNNKPYYNLGTLDQGFWPDGLYTAPTDEALAFDIKAAKAMGFNTIRKHIKVEPARWYYWTDKLGMLVWQDMVNPSVNLPEGSKPEFEKESKEILTQLHNYPSITTWVLFNERWGQYDQARLTTWLKETDPSRIVNGHTGELLYVDHKLRAPSDNPYVNSDMTDVHAYPFPMMSVKQAGKAQVCGEFGGIGTPIEGHVWDDLTAGWGYDGVGTPEKLKTTFSQMIDSLAYFKSNGLSGSIYTQPYDVESEQNGLMTYDREVSKLPMEVYRRIQAKLNPPTKNWAIATAGVSFPVEKNEYASYEARVKAFKNGNRDSVFLRRLTLRSLQEKDEKNRPVFTKAYLLKIEKLYNVDNLNFLKQVTKKSSDPGFEVFQKDSSKVDSILGKNATLGFTNGLFVNELRSLLYETLKPNVTKIESDLIAKYGENKHGLMLDQIALWYILNKDVDNWIIYKNKAFDRYPEIATAYNLNNDAWLLFNHTDDKIKLETALSWSDKALLRQKNDPQNSNQLEIPNNMDTNANLLFKLGRKDEAIKMEQQALEIALKGPYEENIRATLEKIKNGIPTWPPHTNDEVKQ